MRFTRIEIVAAMRQAADHITQSPARYCFEVARIPSTLQSRYTARACVLGWTIHFLFEDDELRTDPSYMAYVADFEDDLFEGVALRPEEDPSNNLESWLYGQMNLRQRLDGRGHYPNDSWHVSAKFAGKYLKEVATILLQPYRRAILNAADQIELVPGSYAFLESHKPQNTCESEACALGWIGYFLELEDPRYPYPDNVSKELGFETRETFFNLLTALTEPQTLLASTDDCPDAEWMVCETTCAKALRIYADNEFPYLARRYSN